MSKFYDKSGNPVSFAEEVFYETPLNTYLCQVDGDYLYCTSLDDFDNVAKIHYTEYLPHRVTKC